MKIDQKNTTSKNTLSVGLTHPSNIPNIERPPRTVCLVICPVLLKYPDEFISNTKVIRNRSTNSDTPLTSAGCPRHLRHDPPPPDTLSGNRPEPVFFPQMNFRSEQRASYPRLSI